MGGRRQFVVMEPVQSCNQWDRAAARNGDVVVDVSAHIKSRQIVRVERNRPSGRFLHGCLLSCCYPVVDGCIGVSDALVLMHPFNDFRPDGYAVIRQQDIVGVRCGGHERLWETMLRGEGLLEDLNIPEGINSSSVQQLVQSVAARFRYMIVECEASDQPIQDFYFGELVAVDSDVIRFRCLNGMARWDDKVVEIPVTEVTKIQFDTPYVQRFTKYIGA